MLQGPEGAHVSRCRLGREGKISASYQYPRPRKQRICVAWRMNT